MAILYADHVSCMFLSGFACRRKFWFTFRRILARLGVGVGSLFSVIDFSTLFVNAIRTTFVMFGSGNYFVLM